MSITKYNKNVCIDCKKVLDFSTDKLGIDYAYNVINNYYLCIDCLNKRRENKKGCNYDNKG